MRKAGKVVITCAVTGSIHTPSMSPHLPVTPEEIAESAVAAAQAGAAVLHLHARNPEDGRPSADPDLFMRFLPDIRARTDAVVNITTGGGPGMSLDARLAAAERAKPELCSLNMGTMNFGAFGLAQRSTPWLHDWEAPFLEGTRAGFQSNTFAQIEEVIARLHGEQGTRFEFECYDTGHLYNLAHFVDRGLLKPPFLIQCILGVLGGTGAEFDNLMHMRAIADRLFGDDWLMSAFAIGRDQMRYAALSALMGGNVRVGLEDSLYAGRGRLSESNAEQVTRVRAIVEALGLEVASPADARTLLALKGADRVSF